VAVAFGLEERVVDNVEIYPKKRFEGFLIEGSQVNPFFLKRGEFDEVREQLLDAVEVARLEEIQMLGRRSQDPGNRLIIEQEMDPDHALGEEMFNLVEVVFAYFEILH
jgi:hypothetical protein